MSDPADKFDWLEGAQRVGLGLVSIVVGVLVRLLFGRVAKDLDDKLAQIPKLNERLDQMEERLDSLEAAPAPQPTPKVGP